MKRCLKCKKRIWFNAVDIGEIDNPLLCKGEYMCVSCFLIMIYEMLDEIKINTHVTSRPLGVD